MVELVVIIEAEEPISVVVSLGSPPPSVSPPSSGQLPLGSGSNPPGQVTPGLVVVVVDGVVDGVVGSVIGSSGILDGVVGGSVVVVLSVGGSISVVEFIGHGVTGDSAVKQKSYTLYKCTLPPKMFGYFADFSTKMALGEVTSMMMPRPFPSSSRKPRTFLKLLIFSLLENDCFLIFRLILKVLNGSNFTL